MDSEISHASLGLLRLAAKNKQTFKADETATITTTTITTTTITTTTTTTITTTVNDYHGLPSSLNFRYEYRKRYAMLTNPFIKVQCVVKSIGLWLDLGWPSQGGPDWVGRAHGNRP
ncbi:hypothetical protein HZH66_007794 [Vespula vulgaris]|uniref:Uncharacterized protein n=1 Tax=Vespula vulgaris TaxID=7454 RepID=A0A834N2S3_VESVU|nr:hypothetical protein HZH66_007794 [Vespula vulgaris]